MCIRDSSSFYGLLQMNNFEEKTCNNNFFLLNEWNEKGNYEDISAHCCGILENAQFDLDLVMQFSELGLHSCSLLPNPKYSCMLGH